MLKSERKGKITGIRLKEEERSLIESAASKTGKGLSEWIRVTLLSAAERQK